MRIYIIEIIDDEGDEDDIFRFALVFWAFGLYIAHNLLYTSR